MSDMLSQDEINALLKGMNEDGQGAAQEDNEQQLQNEQDSIKNRISAQEIDAVGEVSNISMGTAATTLYSILGQKVSITTPKVEMSSWNELVKNYPKPLVAVQIMYKEGLEGNNILFLKEDDVKIITNLMMGGDGKQVDEELTDLHLSAISEAMNQMVGSSSTSLSQMFDKKIDIAPPISKKVLVNDKMAKDSIASFLNDDFIKVSFRLQIGDLIDSELMQLYPFSFVDEIMQSFNYYKDTKKEEAMKKEQQEQPTPQPSVQQPASAPQSMPSPQPMPASQNVVQGSVVDVKRAQFESFEQTSVVTDRSNIDLIMDVPLNVTVELGRTNRSIKEILDFSPGTIIELDKVAGEPIDVLVNGKIVAKGEVVVIAENFSIRITEIIKSSNNINIL